MRLVAVVRILCSSLTNPCAERKASSRWSKNSSNSRKERDTDFRAKEKA